MSTEYKLSGKSGNIFIIGLLLGPISVMLLCVLYAIVNVFNPIIYITILVYAGLLFGIVMVQKLVIYFSKCRNLKSSIIYGTITGLFGIFASWSTFLFVLLRKNDFPIELLELMQNPKQIYEMASLLSIEGYYTLFGIEVAGPSLWLIWIVEAVGILGAGIGGGLVVLHEEIFCENCNRWAEDIDFDLRLEIDKRDDVKNMIETDVEKLLGLNIFKNSNREHIKINLHQCSKCGNTNTIDVDLITYELDKEEKIREKIKDFSKVYVLSANQLNQFKEKKNQAKAQY